MKTLARLLALLAALTAGATPAWAAGWTVGTHRASGSYTCQVSPFSAITWSVSTYLYLAQSPVDPHRWKVQLNPDDSAIGVTLANHQAAPTEAMDNGSVIYTTADTTLYVHRQPSIYGYEYTHDEDTPPYSIQVTAVSTAHPYGQLVIAMSPQGYSDPRKGECAAPVSMTLEISP